MLSHNRKHILYFFLILFFQNQLWSMTDRYRCMWREDPSTTMTIGWEQASGNNPVIYYDEYDGGNEPLNYGFSKNPDRKVWSKGMNNHFARLTNLRPNTVYYFIIKDNEGTSARMSFKTIPDNPYERLSIIAGGDSRNHRKARRKANLLVSKLRPHAVMFGGDMTGGDIERQWKAWLDDWQATMTTDGHLTPIIPARGNHEKSNQSIVDIFDIKHEKIHYALNFGGSLLRIYTLNSMIAAGGNQRAWLEENLSVSSHMKWKLAQYHHAIRPHNSKKSERNTQLKNWANLFYQYGVDLVCESDSHVAKSTYPIRPSKERGSDEGYIRDDERGTVYVGEGCWGAPIRRNDDDKAWTRASGSFNQFKWIFVGLDGIEVRTVKVDNAESVSSVSEYDIFSTPAGLDVWSPTSGSVIRIGGQPSLVAVNDNQPVIKRDPLVNSKAKRNKPSSSVIIPEKKDKPIASTRLLNVKPIEIYGFEAKVKSNEVTVQWLTKNEHLMPTFEIQRSTDGKHYTTFARIKGTGISTNGKENIYQIRDQFSDYAIGILPQYRLRHIHQNGDIMVIQAKMNNKPTNPKPAPKWNHFDKLQTNPQTGQIQFKYKLDKPAKVLVKLLNTSEQQVLKNEFKNVNGGNFLQSIDVSNMAKGEYLLIIEANSKVIQQYKVEKRI